MNTEQATMMAATIKKATAAYELCRDETNWVVRETREIAKEVCRQNDHELTFRHNVAHVTPKGNITDVTMEMHRKAMPMMTVESQLFSVVVKADFGSQVTNEALRLARRAELAGQEVALNMLIGVALENIADNYLRGERKKKTYRELTKY